MCVFECVVDGMCIWCVFFCFCVGVGVCGVWMCMWCVCVCVEGTLDCVAMTVECACKVCAWSALVMCLWRVPWFVCVCMWSVHVSVMYMCCLCVYKTMLKLEISSMNICWLPKVTFYQNWNIINWFETLLLDQ